MLVVPVDGHDVRTPVVWGEPPHAVRELFTRDGLTLADTPILRRSATTARAVYLDDYASEPGAVSGVRGVACGVEPILSSDARVVGFLVVWRDLRDAGWRDGERDLVRRAASTVGLALERADATTRLRDQRDALRDANASLLRSNAELERFAYVASHDLQEPLRTIASFTELLNRRYGDALDEPGRKYLSLVTRGAERMKVLIDDLLVFSRLNAVREPLGPVALDGPLREALERLHAAIESSGARVVFGTLPAVHGHPTELAQVFQNLVGNAVKFRRDGVPPVVEIEARPDGTLWHLTVRDNGIGIEPAYHERIFGIFQRLHTRDRYEGAGMGLAIVRKIVERHGGRVWVESTPGEGTTFHVVLHDARQASSPAGATASDRAVP
jgi:signal transduction histidine kinase